MQTQMEMVRERNARYIGQTLQVMIEGVHPDSDLLLQGRFYGQCPDIDGCVIINDYSQVQSLGQLYEVEITDVMDYDLLGTAHRPVAPKTKRSLLNIL